jgi:hypothetical protein
MKHECDWVMMSSMLFSPANEVVLCQDPSSSRALATWYPTLFLQPNSISFVFGGKIEKLLLLVWSYWMEVTIFLPVILISHRKAQSDIVANYWLRVL